MNRGFRWSRVYLFVCVQMLPTVTECVQISAGKDGSRRGTPYLFWVLPGLLKRGSGHIPPPPCTSGQVGWAAKGPLFSSPNDLASTPRSMLFKAVG